jgi:hypothetical protein
LKVEEEEYCKNEERFLSAWADRIAGAMREENASAHSVRNDGIWGLRQEKRAAKDSFAAFSCWVYFLALFRPD